MAAFGTRGLAATAAAALGLACANVSGSIPARQPPPDPPPGTFRAGARRVDLTPIPGLSLHGYSTAGAVSRGFWTRLYARAIYLEDAQGVPLVLVTCDLAMIPNGLSDAVADRLADDPDLAHVGREQLILAATHTHHGPGNYLTSKLYNVVSPARPGFDPELFAFLADRIAFAIGEAFEDRAPALVRAKTGKVDGLVKNRSLEAFLLNGEAARAFIESSDCSGASADPARCTASCRAPVKAVGGVQVPDLDAYGERDFAACAVDPRIDLLEIRRKDAPNALIAVAGFLAAHNTVLRPDLEIFAGDLFGVSALLLENPIGPPICSHEVPVAALFNGAEGDVMPARARYGERDRVALLDPGALGVVPPPSGRGLALRLAGGICNLLSASAASEPSPAIAFRFGIVPMRGQAFQTSWDSPPSYPRSTAAFGRAGSASVGGSEEDGTSALHEIGHYEGLRNFARGEHGAKIPPFQIELMGRRMSIAGLVFGMNPPPVEAPLGVYRIGQTALVTLPGEFTTMMGRRIRERVREGLSPTPDRVLLVGLANGHISYFTTPEEYDAQHYEGANDFFGPAAGPYLGCELVRLAEILSTGTATQCLAESPPLAPPAELCWPPTGGALPPGQACSSPPAARSYRYSPGSRHVFRPRDAVGPWGNPRTMALLTGATSGSTAAEVLGGNYAAAAPVQRVDDGLSAVVQDLKTRYPDRRLPTFCWYDAIPRLADVPLPGETATSCERAVPRVSVWQEQEIALGAGTVTVQSEIANNDDLDLVTVLTGVSDDRSEWCAIWLVPEGQSTLPGYLFRVEAIREPASGPIEHHFGLGSGAVLVRPPPLQPDLESVWNPLCDQFPNFCSDVCEQPD